MPSIDVPLLRSERSAFRNKQFARWTIVGTVVVAVGATVGVAAHHLSKRNPSDETASNAPEEPLPASDLALPPGQDSLPELVEPPPAAPALPDLLPESQRVTVHTGSATRTTHTFGKALSFRDALEHASLSRDESTSLITALSGTIDFRRSHPEDVFSFERSSEGALTRFEYRASLTQRYEATRDAAGKWKAHQVDVPIRVQRVARGGVVVGSLGDTLEGLKLGRALAGVFSEVFEGHVNFSTDTRTGDQFRIIFDEEYVEDTFLRYGAVHAVEYKGEKAGLLRAFWHESQGRGRLLRRARPRHARRLAAHAPALRPHLLRLWHARSPGAQDASKLHNGIDYAAPSGTVVRAAAAGTVTFAGPKGANGNLLVVAHAQGFETFYAHLSRFATGLKSGAKVKQRQVIAYVGSTGRSTGPHLHFSLKKKGKFIDPASQLNGPGLPMAPSELGDFKRRVRELTTALGKLTPERPMLTQTAAASDVPSDATDLGEEEL